VEGAKVIAKALEINHTLTTLNLRSTDSVQWIDEPKNGMTDIVLFVCMDYCVADNKLGVEGAKVIAKAPESNYTLTTLDLGGTSRREKQENDMAIIYELPLTGDCGRL
jgi:hypothetical protein